MTNDLNLGIFALHEVHHLFASLSFQLVIHAYYSSSFYMLCDVY